MSGLKIVIVVVVVWSLGPTQQHWLICTVNNNTNIQLFSFNFIKSSNKYHKHNYKDKKKFNNNNTKPHLNSVYALYFLLQPNNNNKNKRKYSNSYNNLIQAKSFNNLKLKFRVDSFFLSFFFFIYFSFFEFRTHAEKIIAKYFCGCC